MMKRIWQALRFMRWQLLIFVVILLPNALMAFDMKRLSTCFHHSPIDVCSQRLIAPALLYRVFSAPYSFCFIAADMLTRQEGKGDPGPSFLAKALGRDALVFFFYFGSLYLLSWIIYGTGRWVVTMIRKETKPIVSQVASMEAAGDAGSHAPTHHVGR